MLLEICVENLASAVAARQGGADRLELCSVLGLGGLTPSPGLLRQISSATGLPCMAMIRPRPGNFVYTDAELLVMAEDIRQLGQAGATGFVVGCLTSEGQLDQAALERLLAAAGELPVTFHRAIDVAADPLQLLRDLQRWPQVQRVLSSGQAASAWEGRKLLAEMVQVSGNGLRIMAGAGVQAGNAAALVAATGVTEVHASASRRQAHGPGLLPGARLEAACPEYFTQETLVAALRQALR